MPQISSRFIHIKYLDHNKRASSVLPRSFFRARNGHYSTAVSANVPLKTSTVNHTCTNISLVDVVKKLISKRSEAWVGSKGETLARFSLKDCIFRLHNLCPKVVRRFWRVRFLSPDDVSQILVGSECELGEYEIDVEKVASLWEIFEMASDQDPTFEHLPQSCKIMASMLVRTKLFRECEKLLGRRECEGILVDFEEVFSELIEAYTKEFELDRAMEVYKRMRELSLVPSLSTHHALVKYLVEMNETELMHVVYEEMINMHAIRRTMEDTSIHDDVIRMLCLDGKVREARDLVRKFWRFSIEPSNLVVSAICRGYCNKKDYDGLVSFLVETAVSLDALIGNSIFFSFCRNFSVEKAVAFLHKLEELGYCPDEKTLGALVSLSCREGKLKDALLYISDILSRGVKPHVYTYNAMLCGTFRKGMPMHVRDILLDMNELGVRPNMSTYRVLIAGFCQARKFDEVKAVISEMVDCGMIKLSSVEDRMSCAFSLMGLNPSEVKIKRDNDRGFSRTEFYDDLGNGLYLDAELSEYEEKVAQVLDDSMMLDFSSVIIEKCHSQDIEGALSMVDDLVSWGGGLSTPIVSLLLSLLLRTSFELKTIDYILDIMFRSLYELDQKTLNLLVQTYSKKGFSYRARALVDGMLRKGLFVEDCTYSTLLFGSCKKGDLRRFRHYFKISRSSNWSPEMKDYGPLLGHLIRNKWLDEALELFEIMPSVKPDNPSVTFHILFEKLSRHGYCDVAYAMVEEFSNEALFLVDVDYRRLISNLCLQKRFKEAYILHNAMLIRGISPPMEASIELISHLCRTDNFDQAVKVRNVYLKDQPSALLHLNSALIDGACKLRRPDGAVNLFKELLSKDMLPKNEVFNSLIMVFCDGKNVRKVCELLGYMIKNGLSISVCSYSNMVRLICTVGNPSLAMNLKDVTFQATGVPRLPLYNILLFRLSSMGKSSLLNKAIEELEKEGLQFDDASYNLLIAGKDPSLSLHYLSTMMQQGLRPSNRILRKAITFLCCEGKLDLALSLSQEMESRGLIHGTFLQNKMVETLIFKGQAKEAVEFLDRIESKGLSKDDVNYDYSIKLLCRHGMHGKAVDLLDRMLERGNCPEAASYDYIVLGFCSSTGQNLDMALDLHAEMLHRKLRPDRVTWDALISCSDEHNRLAEAESLIESMVGLGLTPSEESLRSVVGKLRALGNFNKTSQMLQVMQKCGYVPDFDTHWSVISNLSSSSANKDGGNNNGFLSGLISGLGFTGKARPDSRN